MKPCILICDTCGATVPERGATPEQRQTMLPVRDGGNLMLRRRAAAHARAQIPADADACPKCAAALPPRHVEAAEDGVLRAMGGGGGGPVEPY